MELRQIQHFIAVAEELNFTRAAARVHIVQSALSTSIRLLEEELKAKLFVRNTRQVQITPTGRAFLDKAREILRSVEVSRDTVAEIEGLTRGTLSIGTVHSLPAFLDMPALIARYHGIAPGIEVRLRQGDFASLIEQLRSGRLDLAFLPLLDVPDDMFSGIVACEDMVVVTPPNHPLAGRTNLSLRDLVEYRFVDFDTGWGTRPLVDRAFGQLGLQRQTAFDVTDLETVIDLVGEGLGIALLPETIAALRAPTIASGLLEDPQICWELLVAYLRGENDAPLSGAAQAFLGLLTFW